MSVTAWGISTFSQKNELKAAEKALKIKDYPTAITAISSAESLIANMDDKIKGKFYFLKAQAFYGKKDFQTAANAFENLFNLENETGKMRYTQMATTLQNQMVQEVYQLASDQYTAKDYKNASDSFYLTYQLSRADTIFVYNAAVSSSLAKDYDNSLKYYKELQDIGYTGISKIYYATNKQSDEKEDLGDEKNRDLQVKLGLYKDPVNELTESKTGDIIKNGTDGFLVANGAIEDLSTKINGLIEDELLRHNMGKQARENVKRFLPINIIKQWDNLFKQLINF